MVKINDMNATISALKFENSELQIRNSDDRVKASKRIKKLIGEINTINAKSNDPYLLDILNRLQTLRSKVERSSQEPITS